MTAYLSDDLRRALSTGAHGRLRAVAGAQSWPILRVWRSGFALSEADAARRLPALVALYDGDEPLGSGLAYLTAQEGGECHFAFKLWHEASDAAPSDFAPPERALPAHRIGH